MKTIPKTLLIHFALLMVFGAVLAHAQQVGVKNSSSYVGGGRWDWTIYIDADASTLEQIECVEYQLHPTFQNPLRKVCKPDTKFALSSNGWGTFNIGVNIIYKDRHTQQLKHELVFKEKSAISPLNVMPKKKSRELLFKEKSATSPLNVMPKKKSRELIFKEKSATLPLNVIPKNRSHEIEEGWWEWELFIDGREEELAKIRCVEYTLHKSFPNPVRMVCSHDNKFLLVGRGWGMFTVKILLILNDGSIHHMSHPLSFN